MSGDWQIKHRGLTKYLESIETDPAQLSNFIKGLSFPVGHVMGQTDFVSWDEMKRTAFDEKALGQIAKQAREWRGDRTPNTPMYWAYEIVAISLESTSANDPIAIECEKLTDGLIGKAIHDFLNRKPPTGVIHTSDRMSPADEETRDKEVDGNKGFTIERGGGPLDAILKREDMYAEMGVSTVKTLKKFAEEDGAPPSIKAHWRIVARWLELGNSKIGPLEEMKIEIAWKAYLAKGSSPSHELQPVFDEAAKSLNVEGYNFKPDLPPGNVLHAFDCMLATDAEIKQKRLHNQIRKLPRSGKAPLSRRIRSYIVSLLRG
jgi:hypothetical protein